MKVTLHLEGNRQEILNQIAEFKTVLDTSLAAQAPAGTMKLAETTTAKAPKKGKEKAPPVVEEEETEAAESEDDMGFSEEEEAEEEAEEISQTDVVKACRDYAKGNDQRKERVKKLLSKFKTKSVLDLKAAQYPEFLASLKKL